jgi:hypothetical protein
MTRTSTLLPALLLMLGVTAQALAQSTPSQAPPKLEKIEEPVGDPITVTSKPAENKITEKREGGRVVEATVKSGPSTYTVRPNHPAGTALPGDAMGGANRGPQWTVMEFDIGKKKKKAADEDSAADTSAPPAPPAPTVSK